MKKIIILLVALLAIGCSRVETETGADYQAETKSVSLEGSVWVSSETFAGYKSFLHFTDCKTYQFYGLISAENKVERSTVDKCMVEPYMLENEALFCGGVQYRYWSMYTKDMDAIWIDIFAEINSWIYE